MTTREDLAEQLRRYVAWRSDGYLSSIGRCFDIGGTTSAQLARFERTGEPVDPRPDADSAANGSLMRLAPVPIRWHADPAEAAERSAESSRTTHAAERPVDACRVLGAMTAALTAGEPAEAVLCPDFWRWGPLHPAVEAVARGSWTSKEPPAIRGTGYCVDALEAAIWAVAGAHDLRDAVVHAWRVDEHVLAGEYPASGGGPARSDEKLQVLVDAGVRTFVDLTTPDDHLDPYEHRLAATAEMRRLDLRRINVPIPDLDVVADHRYDEIIATIDRHRAHGGVYVHCWGGVGRTGTVIGCLLADAGHDHDSIHARLAELRAGTRKAHRRCPETHAQREVLRRRAAR